MVINLIDSQIMVIIYRDLLNVIEKDVKKVSYRIFINYRSY